MVEISLVLGKHIIKTHRHPIIPRSSFTSNPFRPHACIAQRCDCLLSTNLVCMGDIRLIVVVL